MSLELIGRSGISPTSAVIDVGGGASTLVDALVHGGFTDLTVLDISAEALQKSKERVGTNAPVAWIAHDLLSWEPNRHYELWHDRAVFHFLSGSEVETYRALLLRAVAPGGFVVLATFALDGPERCSGLPVTRYDVDHLVGAVGNAFTLVDERRNVHTTPGGATQPFTWIVVRRTED